MADSVEIDTSPLSSESSDNSELLVKDPELQSVTHECETLTPQPELESIPPIIGTGAVPQEKNNNQPIFEEESAEVLEKHTLEDPEKVEETIEATPEEEPMITEEKCEEEFKKIIKTPEFKAMATLLESTIATVSRQLQPMTDKLYEKKYPVVEGVLDKLEKACGAKREKLVYGAIGSMVLYVIIGSLLQIVCNLVGFLYPAYRSVKAVRSPLKDDDTQWLIYWVVFASFSVIDLSIFSSIPFYWLAKVVFLLYLYLPSFKGANIVYEKYIDPACTVIETYFTPVEKKQQ